jgi:hypothetical protein
MNGMGISYTYFQNFLEQHKKEMFCIYHKPSKHPEEDMQMTMLDLQKNFEMLF